MQVLGRSVSHGKYSSRHSQLQDKVDTANVAYIACSRYNGLAEHIQEVKTPFVTREDGKSSLEIVPFLACHVKDDSDAYAP
jgi:hypothetical protein